MTPPSCHVHTLAEACMYTHMYKEDFLKKNVLVKGKQKRRNSKQLSHQMCANSNPPLLGIGFKKSSLRSTASGGIMWKWPLRINVLSDIC